MRQISPTAKMKELVELVMCSPHATYLGDYWWYVVGESPSPTYILKKEESPVLNDFNVIKARRVDLVRDNREKDRCVRVIYKDLDFIHSPKFGFYTEEKEDKTIN